MKIASSRNFLLFIVMSVSAGLKGIKSMALKVWSGSRISASPRNLLETNSKAHSTLASSQGL